MANETVVRVSADASGYTSEMERARRSADAFVASQEAAARRTIAAQAAVDEAVANGSQASTRQINAFMQSLARQADQAGKTRAELLQMQAAALGVSGSAQQYIDQIEKANAATGHLEHGTAGARREMLVLAHEASQGNWKNFAGSLMVLGEQMDIMGKLLSPVGLSIAVLAAGVAAVAVAAIKGAEETKQFNAALILTSNYAGITRDSLEGMAESIANASGGSLGHANEVLLNLAQSGKYTSDEMSGLANVIVRTSQISGQSLEDVGKEYSKLADDPAKWAVEHNSSMHFMDVATYQHIQALQEAGDKHKAVQAVIDATLAQVESSSNTHLSAAAQAWRSLSGEIQTFWQKLKQGLSSGPSLQDQIDTLTNERKDLQGYSIAGDRVAEIDRRVAALKALQRNQADNAALQAANAEREQVAVEAAQRVDKVRDQIMTNAQRREKELGQLAKDRQAILSGGGAFSDADYERMVAGINEKYKDPKGPRVAKPKAYQDDAATRMEQQLRDQQATLEAQLSTTGKLSTAESELAKFNQQIADWKDKTLTVDQKSLVAHQDQIRAQLQKNVGLEAEVKHRDEVAKLQERSAQIDASIASYQQKQRDQYGRELGAFGMGSDALKNVQAVKGIYAEYQRQQDQLNKSTPKDLIGGADYQAASANIKAGLDQSLKDYDTYYTDLKAKQADWTNGATAAIANYMDSAHNMAAQTESAVTNAAKGMEDALTSFVTTGKLNFTSLANSIIADIARMQVRTAVSGLFNMVAGLIGGGIAGSFGTLATTSTAAGAASDVMGSSYSSGLMGPSGVMPSYSSLPARAGGGPVDGGTTYLVGEKGPELFVPGQSGSIVPNHALGGGGGGDVSVQIVNNSTADVQQPQVSQDSSGKRFIRLIIDQAKSEMASDVAGGQGSMSKALGARYGLTPRFR
ncbi:phage tail tape measure protein [Caballeronia glebae]|uniref:phage tail tape measure protein n=1 Tax=Caballeronia glebae TaxID=1777143 RepID=UPI0038BA10A6